MVDVRAENGPGPSECLPSCGKREGGRDARAGQLSFESWGEFPGPRSALGKDWGRRGGGVTLLCLWGWRALFLRKRRGGRDGDDPTSVFRSVLLLGK